MERVQISQILKDLVIANLRTDFMVHEIKLLNLEKYLAELFL
jgi:hypothetical protein